MTITWRDVTAPNQSAALGFAQTGANQIGRSINTVTQLASNIAGQELADFNRQREQNTSSLLQRINEIGDLDTFNETSGSDEFSVDNLRSTFGDAVDISAVQQGLSNRRNALTQLRDETETRDNLEALRGVDNIMATQGIDAALEAVETNDAILDKTGAKNALYGLQEQNKQRENALKNQRIQNLINTAAMEVWNNPDNHGASAEMLVNYLHAEDAAPSQIVQAFNTLDQMQIARNRSSPLELRRAEAVLEQEIVNTERELSQMEEDMKLYEANNPYSDTRWAERNSEELAGVYAEIDRIAPFTDFFGDLGGADAKKHVKELASSYAIFSGDEQGQQVYRKATPEEIEKYAENEQKKEDWAEAIRAGKPIDVSKKPNFNMPTLARIQPWHIKNSLLGASNDLPQETRGSGFSTGNTEILKDQLDSNVYQLAVESTIERYKSISEAAKRKGAIRAKQTELDSIRRQVQSTRINPPLDTTSGADNLRSAAR